MKKPETDEAQDVWKRGMIIVDDPWKDDLVTRTPETQAALLAWFHDAITVRRPGVIIGMDMAMGPDRTVVITGEARGGRGIVYRKHRGVGVTPKTEVRSYDRLVRRDMFGLTYAHVHPSPEPFTSDIDSRAMVWLLIAGGAS